MIIYIYIYIYIYICTKASKLTVEDMRYLRNINRENRKVRIRKNTEFQNTFKYNLTNNINS